MAKIKSILDNDTCIFIEEATKSKCVFIHFSENICHQSNFVTICHT